MSYLSHYLSPLGPITMASDGIALTGLWFDGQKYFASTLAPDVEERSDLPVFAQTRRWLDIYFTGHDPGFAPHLHHPATPFRTMVWQCLRGIPYGATATYADIARQIARQRGLPSMSAQAVGAAVSRNPISIIIPCHRVIASDGSLTGYAAGLDRKAALLRLEHSQPYPSQPALPI